MELKKAKNKTVNNKFNFQKLYQRKIKIPKPKLTFKQKNSVLRSQHTKDAEL